MLLTNAALCDLVTYKRVGFEHWDVSYDPVSNTGSVLVWWVRSMKEEQKLLKHVAEMYAPAWVKEAERNRAKRKLWWTIAQLFLEIQNSHLCVSVWHGFFIFKGIAEVFVPSYLESGPL